MTLEKATDKSRSPNVTTVAEHLFDPGSTRRVWHDQSISADSTPQDISAELADISSYGGFFALTVGGDPTGWRPVGTCYADGFADLVDVTAARYRASERRIGTSLVHLGHAARLWSPVLACVLAHGVLPDLTALQRADHRADLRLPAPVGEPATADPELLYRVVVGDQMERFAAGLDVNLASGLLYGNIASALVGTSRMLLAARPDLRASINELTAALLDVKDLAETGVITSRDLSFRRTSCCLYYRLPGGGKCGDCGLD